METKKTTAKEAKETVTVHFPAPTSRDEEAFVLVGANGKMYQIKKGEDVEVPPIVADIIKNAEKQKDENAKRMIESAIK